MNRDLVRETGSLATRSSASESGFAALAKRSGHCGHGKFGYIAGDAADVNIAGDPRKTEYRRRSGFGNRRSTI